MSSREDAIARARRESAAIRRSIGESVREARLLAGVSQRVVAGAAAMSHAQVGRIERAELTGLTIDQLTRACAAVGLRLRVATYPGGDAVRDEAHLALISRLRARLPQDAGWQTEVPLPIPGDRRAWDAVVTLGGARFAIEAETRLRDVQALERRLALKQRDGEMPVVIVVVSETRANADALDTHRAALRERLPLDSRAILASFAARQVPAASGILVL